MKKVVRNILLSIYFVIAFFITYCLITYNNYDIAEFKDRYIFTIDDDNEIYNKYDLIVTKKDNQYEVDDTIFYYKVTGKDVEICINKIKKIDVIDERSVFKLDNDMSISGERAIGSSKNTKSYALVGGLYSILISKWGYFCLIILPIFSLLFIEIRQIIKEFKSK